ncbi:flagellar basal body-associated FliL family protein [Roseovarius sp. 2305UL8-3]|uniref:flagellar basal body-associated FliL family protein n=1 Tax=Roseovarius conchicola TaxID=3121636 RepID=UPI003528ECC5
MNKILPVLLLLVGTGAGIGAGIVLKPSPADMADEHAQVSVENPQHEDGHDATQEKDESDIPEYVELNNQFVVPVVRDDMVDSLVVMSLGIEVDAGGETDVYRREPKLRDVLLQVLFDHANVGGFHGRFTDGNTMDTLRMALTEAAQSVVGKAVRAVVITDIARQDV